MPEGPEAHTIAKYLKEKIEGKHLLSITVKPRAKKVDLDLIILPIKVIDVYAYGKRPIFQLEDDTLIATFLSMTGKWCFEEQNHTSLICEFGDYMKSGKLDITDNEFSIYFDDIRTFGKVTYLYNNELNSSYFSKIGPDLISQPPTLKEYVNVFKSYGKKKEICQFLMDQSQFSGIGNYLKAEILYLCKIKPNRLMEDIEKEEIKLLYKYSLKVINKSLKYGGLTISDYWTPDGRSGDYPRLVYGLKEDANGYKILKDTFKDRRTTHWVEEVQI